MTRANQDLRQAARESGVYLYQLAEAVGVNDGNFSRRLRHELPEAEKQRLLGMIGKIAAAEKGGADAGDTRAAD